MASVLRAEQSGISRDRIRLFEQKASQIVLDMRQPLRMATCCILARGHLLIEDLPGMGKTTLVKTIGSLLGLKMNRIQFTNDMLPADILGVSILEPGSTEFRFHAGPIFTHLLLADEINRASPKTQSASLQAMEEGQVSLDGQTHTLPDPFIVVATQNPGSSIGTFPLPESQLDRFLMRLAMGFPGREAERMLLMGQKRSEMIEELEPVVTRDELMQVRLEVDRIHASENIVTYIQDILEESRTLYKGLSTRSGLGLLAASRAHAYLEDRDFVLPEDVQAVAVAVMNHRIQAHTDAGQNDGFAVARDLLARVPIT